MELGLGTVQFGGPYGAIDHDVVPGDGEVSEMLWAAADGPVSFFDTAAGYGDAESCLGRHLGSDCPIPVVTKLSPVPEDCTDIWGYVQKCVDESRANLGGIEPDTVMIHRPEDATGPYGREILANLQQMKAMGRIRHVGVSLYDQKEIEACDGLGDVDCIQLPVNVVDQRLIRTGFLKSLSDMGIRLIARSAFLQGLLLADEVSIPNGLDGLANAVGTIRYEAAKAGVTPLLLCLGFLKSRPEIDAVVVGANSLPELFGIFDAWREDVPTFPWSEFSLTDETLLDPRKWPAT